VELEAVIGAGDFRSALRDFLLTKYAAPVADAIVEKFFVYYRANLKQLSVDGETPSRALGRV
jgi:hypothetical protein